MRSVARPSLSNEVHTKYLPTWKSTFLALPPGSFTDDTSMMLCLATSLISQKQFDPIDQIDRYARWKFNGYLSSSEEKGCFDIGHTTSSAIDRYVRDVEKRGCPHKQFYGSDNPEEAGNGGIMRLTPIPIVYRADVDRAKEYAVLSSKVTHGSLECLDAARVMTDVIVRLLQGSDKNNVPSRISTRGVSSEKITDICRRTYLDKDESEISTSGYVVHTLEATLWAFHMTDTFEEGMMLLAGMGDDVDTVCCVYGAIAGAYYGYAAIPDRWKNDLVKMDVLRRVAIDICTLKL